MEGPLHVIVNPAAGNGRTARLWPRVAARLRDRGLPEPCAHPTAGPDDATRIVRDLLQAGAREIVVVGGDGTVNEAVNGFFLDGAPLAPEAVLSVIPGGTGRDFARTLGIRDAAHAVDVLLDGTIAAIDVGHITFQAGDERRGRYFVNVADVGLGGATAARINRSSKILGGFLSYFIGAAYTILTYRGHRARVVVDGATVHDGPVAIVVMANGRFHAGGMRMAPIASLTDGYFEVLVLEDVPKRTLLTSLLPSVYRGSHLGHPAVRHVQGRTVEVLSTEHLLFEADGEQPGTTDVAARVVPSALRVRLPGHAPEVRLSR